LRNKIYGYLDPYRTKTRTVYTSEYRTLSQSSHQLRTEVMSFAMNHSTFYMMDADFNHFRHALKDMKKEDDSGVTVGIYGKEEWMWSRIDAYSILMHLEPRRKDGVRYFVIKGLFCLNFDDEELSFDTSFYYNRVVKFLEATLQVGTIKRDALVEDAWCYVEVQEE
jgi:hypothetical protein